MDSQSSASPSGTSAPPVFLTGAAGFVGANLVRRLLVDGVRVRVLLRPEDNNEALDGLDVERVYGDIRDLNVTKQALAGCHGYITARPSSQPSMATTPTAGRFTNAMYSALTTCFKQRGNWRPDE